MESAFGSDIIQIFFHASLVVKLVLLILAIFSIISCAIIFTKLRFYKNVARETEYFLDLFWENTEFSRIYEESQDLIFSPVAHIFRSGYSEFMRIKKIQRQTEGNEAGSKMNNISDYVERSLKKTAMHQSGRMEKTLSFLATTGNTAPFVASTSSRYGCTATKRGF